MTDDAPKPISDDFLRMTAQMVAAYLRKNSVPTGQITEVINSIYSSLRAIDGRANAPTAAELKPAVPIKKSVTPEYVICLEDGRKLKMLKRHLRTEYNMTPEQYRQKWGLPADYPMVAPNYAKQRSAFAKEIGLGKGAGKKPK
ncbi:MAG: MucR family transcriptional regulator [Alphaproteobacteria bacterium]|nr:MucR family transcriptional regulator [Alphaproteobacteria bacterium]